MRRVRELQKLTRHEERSLFADVDGVVPDPLEAPSDGDLPHSPLERLGVVHVTEHLAEHLPVRPVDELVELVQLASLLDIALRKRGERHLDHFRRALAHVDKALHDRLLGAEVARELGQLGDRDALVADPLEMERVVEQCEHEPEVGCHGRLAARAPSRPASRSPWYRSSISSSKAMTSSHSSTSCVRARRRATDRAQDDLARLLEPGFEGVQLGLQPNSHPNRPVT